MAPLYGGWLVFFMMSATLVPQPVGQWCRALSFGLLFGPAIGVGCGLGLIPAWLCLLLCLQSGCVARPSPGEQSGEQQDELRARSRARVAGAADRLCRVSPNHSGFPDVAVAVSVRVAVAVCVCVYVTVCLVACVGIGIGVGIGISIGISISIGIGIGIGISVGVSVTVVRATHALGIEEVCGAILIAVWPQSRVCVGSSRRSEISRAAIEIGVGALILELGGDGEERGCGAPIGLQIERCEG